MNESFYEAASRKDKEKYKGILIRNARKMNLS